jgi:5'-3' exonuclease
MFRALLGDKSDNIDGIRGAGEKTILKYVPEFADPSVEVNVALIEQKYRDAKKKPKVIETILDNTDIVSRNLQLMQLRDVNISVDAKMKILHKFEQSCPPLRKSDLTKLFVKSKIITSIPNYDEWITFSFSTLARFYARP